MQRTDLNGSAPPAAAPARPGQAGREWARDDWAPLQFLNEDQLAHFNRIVNLHRHLVSRLINSEFYPRIRKFFKDVIYKVDNIQLRYAYCVGLGNLRDDDRELKDGETHAQMRQRAFQEQEMRIAQFVLFQTCVDLLNAGPQETHIEPNRIYIQERGYGEINEEGVFVDQFMGPDAIVDKLFFWSMGYNAPISPASESQLRNTGSRSFLFAPDLPTESLAALHGNACAFPGLNGYPSGIPLFISNDVVNHFGRWFAKLEMTDQEQQRGDWIYLKIAGECVRRSLESVYRPINWVHVPKRWESFENLWIYWRLDKDHEHQIINIHSYDAANDPNGPPENDAGNEVVDGEPEIKNDNKYWDQNDNTREMIYVIGESLDDENSSPTSINAPLP